VRQKIQELECSSVFSSQGQNTEGHDVIDHDVRDTADVGDVKAKRFCVTFKLTPVSIRCAELCTDSSRLSEEVLSASNASQNAFSGSKNFDAIMTESEESMLSDALVLNNDREDPVDTNTFNARKREKWDISLPSCDITNYIGQLGVIMSPSLNGPSLRTHDNVSTVEITSNLNENELKRGSPEMSNNSKVASRFSGLDSLGSVTRLTPVEMNKKSYVDDINEDECSTNLETYLSITKHASTYRNEDLPKSKHNLLDHIDDAQETKHGATNWNNDLCGLMIDSKKKHADLSGTSHYGVQSGNGQDSSNQNCNLSESTNNQTNKTEDLSEIVVSPVISYESDSKLELSVTADVASRLSRSSNSESVCTYMTDTTASSHSLSAGSPRGPDRHVSRLSSWTRKRQLLPDSEESRPVTRSMRSGGAGSSANRVPENSAENLSFVGSEPDLKILRRGIRYVRSMCNELIASRKAIDFSLPKEVFGLSALLTTTQLMIKDVTPQPCCSVTKTKSPDVQMVERERTAFGCHSLSQCDRFENSKEAPFEDQRERIGQYSEMSDPEAISQKPSSKDDNLHCGELNVLILEDRKQAASEITEECSGMKVSQAERVVQCIKLKEFNNSQTIARDLERSEGTAPNGLTVSQSETFKSFGKEKTGRCNKASREGDTREEIARSLVDTLNFSELKRPQSSYSLQVSECVRLDVSKL